MLAHKGTKSSPASGVRAGPVSQAVQSSTDVSNPSVNCAAFIPGQPSLRSSTEMVSPGWASAGNLGLPHQQHFPIAIDRAERNLSLSHRQLTRIDLGCSSLQQRDCEFRRQALTGDGYRLGTREIGIIGQTIVV